MNTAYKWLLLIFLFAAPAFAQNVRVDNVAFSSVQGFPFLPGATITICTAAGSGVPCTPTVAGTCLSISDATCNQSPTITADALGNYGFWIQPGSYTYTVTKAGFGGFGPKSLTLACQPAGSCNVASQWNFTNENDILWVGTGGYATIAAAITAAGATNKTIIGIRSSYAGTECPTFQSNLTFWDFRGGNLVNCTQNVAVYNTDDGNVKAMVKETSFFTAVDAAGGDVTRWMLTYLSNATVVASDVVDGLEDDARTINTLTGTLGILDGAEATADVQSSGGTISIATGTAGLVSTLAASTTAVTNAYGFYGIGCAGNIAGAVPTNCYGVYAKSQAGSASSRNYSFGSEGISLFRFDAVPGKSGFDFEDHLGATHPILYNTSSDVLALQATGAQGTQFLNSAGGLRACVDCFNSGFNISSIGNNTGLQVFNTTTSCTTAAAVGATCTTANISLPVTENDTSYRVVCTAKPALTAVPVVIATTNVSTTQFTITIAALTAVAASAASYDCFLGHN